MWTPRREILAFWFLYAVSFGLRILASPFAGVAHEELHTPTAAALLATAPRPSLLPELQYMAFCGGCTVETVLVAPFFAALGPHRLVWKGVPLAFGLVTLTCAWMLSRRMAGPVGGRVCALALVFAPTWYGANSIVAFGAHTEVMALVLLSLMLWHPATESPRKAGFLGLSLGAAFWFDHAAAFTWPILLPAWLLAVQAQKWKRKGCAHLLGGVLIGLVPWGWTQWTLRAGGRIVEGGWLSVYGEGPADLLRGSLPHIASRINEMAGPVMWKSMFLSVLESDQWIPGLAVTLAAITAIGVVAWEGIKNGKKNTPATWLPFLAVGLVVSFSLCYLFLAPQLAIRTSNVPLSANALRYLMPLGTLVAICMGVATRTRFGRVIAIIAIGTSGGIRLAEISPKNWTTKGFDLPAVDPSMLADRSIIDDLPDPQSITTARFIETLDALPSASRHKPHDARHLMAEAVGLQLLGPVLEQDAKAEPWERSLSAALLVAGELTESERGALIRGAALYLQRYGGWIHDAPASRPTEKLKPLLKQADANAVETLCRGLLEHSGPHPTSQLQDAILDHRNTPWQRALTWHLEATK